MVFSDSSCKNCPYTVRITEGYIAFYQGGPIDHFTHVTGVVAQSSAESDYNTASTVGMYLAHFRMLKIVLLNKDPYVVPEQAPLIILDRKSAIPMDKNDKDTKHTRHISRRINFVRNGK